jgi:hypothetical protein
MAVKTGDAIAVSFTTQRFDTGAATNADSLPTGTLYVNGVSNAATVTVTNTTTGQYRAAVTLPTLATGDRCEIAIAATVNSVAGRGIIWRDACDIATDSTGRVTVGSNADKTGYDLTQTFPANFSALGINASGHVSRVTLVDTTTTNTDMRGTDGAALASNWTSTRAGYLDLVLLAANSNRTVQVTGSNHVAADMHESQPGSFHASTFEAGAIDATAIAADAITAAKVAADVGTEIGAAVWSNGTRILTAGTNIVLAKGTGITGLNDITANAAADAILVRGAANVESSAEAYSLADMLLGVFESKVEAGTWTIYRSDGTTVHRTKTITTDGTAEPITRVQ